MTPTELADSLTDAQQEVLMLMSDGEMVYPASKIAAEAGFPLKETVKVLRHLRGIGVADRGPLWSDDDGLLRGSGTWLSPLGLEVRTILASLR